MVPENAGASARVLVGAPRHRPACYFVSVALRYALLAIGAALVLGGSVYLFFEVRARPAQAGAPERAAPARAARQPELDAEEDPRPPPARATPAPAAQAVVREPPRGPDGAPEDPAPQKLDALMSQANKAYDRGELDDAMGIARRVLRSAPDNVRMLRIMVSASCIAGDTAEAQAAYLKLPPRDREQMRTRCARVGVGFTEP